MSRKNKSLNDMGKNEKKELLSNDLTERMIRVEQRVSMHFRKPVMYKETQYYKSMTKSQREKFEKYLVKKKRKKYLLGGFLILPLLALFLFRFRITGSVVSENIGSGNLSIAVILMIIIAFVIAILILFYKRKEVRYDKMLKKHYSVLHNVLSGKIQKSKVN